MKVNSIKFKKHSFTYKNIINSRLYFSNNKSTFHSQNLKYLKGFRNNFGILDISKIELSLKKALKLIYNLNKKKKRILFVGLPDLKENFLSANSLHDFVSENYWVSGILSNKTSVLNNLKYKNASKLFAPISVMGKTTNPDIIVILNNNFEKNFLTEIYQSNIPVISLINYNHNFEKIDFKIFGCIQHKESKNFFYSLLQTALEKK